MVQSNGWVQKFITGILLVVILTGAVATPGSAAQAQQARAETSGALGTGLNGDFRAPLYDACTSPVNEIVAENCQTGNPPSEWDVSGAGDISIQGFATDISVNRGNNIQFKIDTTAATYDINIYRLGYYGGDGARLVHTIEDVTGTEQPACSLAAIPIGGGSTTSGQLLDCGNWSVSASWAVPANATSGVYIARPTRDDTNGASHIPFIVRDDTSDSNLLFQTSDTTWQSYNPYGGYNAYGSSGATMAEKLSYNRPFTTRGAELENYLFNAEYPMIRWLERNGYDVSYMSAIDVERYASQLLNHQVYLSVGHDEYWSQGRRDAVTAARDAGVHLAFFSGNEVYWKTRWEASTADGGSTDYRTQVVYKEGNTAPSGSAEHRNCYNNYDCDPSLIWTGQWREAPGSIPENSLSGQISWRLDQQSINVPGEFAPLRFWRDTDIAGLSPLGEVQLADGVLGYEWDPEYTQYADWYPVSRIWLSTTDVISFVGPEQHHLSLYRAPSGALVFGAGTVQWSWGLDSNHDREASVEDANVQQATVNLFADMGVQPATLQTGLTAATPSADITAPTVTITSPANGANISGGNITVTGTASDTGGVVAAVKVSTDGGATWDLASGTTNWIYTFNAISESVIVQVVAIDDSVNLGTPSSISINADAQTCPCSIFTPATTGAQENDPGAVELGVKFRSDEAGYITGIRFYKTAGNTGTHTGRLWTTGGVNLGTVTFTGETASGWQEALFSSPIPIDAGTTYLASYHTTSGNYAIGTSFVSAGVDNPPLHALQGGVDGPNGVYEYGPGGVYPDDSFGSSNYLVDVVFVTSVGPDTTPPTVTQVAPINGAVNVNPGVDVTVTFNEAIDPLTITGATFELRDGSNALIPASVSYDVPSRTATLNPNASLNLNTTYTATVIGDPNGVADLTGNELATDYVWTFTTQGPPPDEGPGGPILVLSAAANPFSRYYAEILRAEGLNAFTVTDISNLTAPLLDNYQVVILGEMNLTAPQVTLLTEWVNDDGGNLIAMRPDSQLANLLGLTSAGSTLSEAYLLVNTASAPGQGIVNETIQFHGTADRYTLNGATAVATLYSNVITATSNPAVTLKSVGSNGGQAAAFTYDLAKSIVYTRQGNPAWIDINGDGSLGPVRADDMFHNGTDPDWVNLDKVAIPQADEQQRLLANMILFMNADNNPLPRFWYFPRFEKAVVVMTADDHASSNVAGRFDQYIAASPSGCSVEDWECIRASVYIYSGTTLSATQANNYTADGFEIGAHVDTSCNAYTLSELQTFYTSQLAAFASRFPALPQQDSERTHCISWSGWAYQAQVKEDKGIRLDTNYYYWPPAWVNDRPGFFTGSGMPMRFADQDGTMFDVYQAVTQMTDESGQSYPFTIDTLIGNALGSEGYYGVFTANMHSDNLNSPGSDAIVASAQANGVPVISGRQLLEWLDGRNLSAFSGINWTGNTLNFNVSVGGGANGLTAMLPIQSAAGNLQSITRNSSPVTFSTETIKGVEYAVFSANPGGDFAAVYAPDTAAPIISAVIATPNSDGTVTITWTTDEPSDSRVDYGTVSGSLNLNASQAALVTSHSVTLTGLTAGTTYYFTVTSEDAANNSASSTEDSFVASANLCPCSIWDNTGTPTTVPIDDGQPIELGTKFRSSMDGFITAIRYYKGAGDTDTHVGHLWTSSGVQLAEVTFAGESASGWQEMEFPTPIAIDANTTYIVSIFSSPTGYFAITPSGLSNAVDNPPLRALASGEDGPNGVYAYGGGFPANGNNANYWVDAVFEFADETPPTITDRSPAADATGVSRNTNITVTFSEDINPATLTDTTFTLRAAGAGSDVPAAISYAGSTATLNPVSDLLPDTEYQVTISGSITDLAGNPLGSNTIWTFTTNNLTQLTDTSTADFTAGTLNACVIDTSSGDGAVKLGPGLNEDFSGSTLPSDWSSHTWTSGTPVVGSGLLSVNGSIAYTDAEYGPERVLEFAATFNAQPFQHIGFGGDLVGTPFVPYNGPPWIMFSTSTDGAQLYARVLPAGSTAYNTGNDKIPLGNYLGSQHTYRIEWKANSIDFYIDGALKTTVAASIATPMRIAASDVQSDAPGASVDWLRMDPPYASPCTFESRIFDAGTVVDWSELTSTQSLPTDTAITFETRTGNAAIPDGSWSSWEAVNSPIASPNGRYAQYRTTLSTTNTDKTPILEQVALSYANNSAPSLNSIGGKTVGEENLLAFTATGTDDGLPSGTLTFNLEDGTSGSVPTGAVITTGGAFTWTPTEAQGPADYTFDVCVSDGALSDCETITVTVNEANVAPVLGLIGNKTITELVQLSFTATATDDDVPANTLTYSLEDGTSGEVPTGTVITTGGAFTWTPTEAQGPSDYTFDVCVSDGTLSDCETVTVTVNEANIAPVLGAIGNKTITELVQLSFTATATDDDVPANTLTYSLDNEPAGAVITTGGAFAWTPTEAQGPADYTFDVCVSDGTLSDCETITVTVNEANVAPVLGLVGNKTITELTQLSFTATATDDDVPSNTLTYSLSNEPAGAVITTGGAFTWTPTEAQGPADYTFDVCVSDGTLNDCETITVTVNEANTEPVLGAIGNKTIAELTQLAFNATASDDDVPANTLTYSLDNEPAGAVITTGGAFTWTPTEAQGPADYTFDVCVSDGTLSDCEIITVTVNEANVAPVLGLVGNKTITELTQLSFTATATDDDVPSNTLTYSLSNEPAGAIITTGGAFTWTPTEAQGPADYTFDVCVSDGTLNDCETITVTVNEANVAPVLDSIGNRIASELVELTFTATASDLDLPANTLTFTLENGTSGNVPAGASISAGGDFTWTPTEAQGATDYTFDICVSDGALSDCETITIEVVETNEAPEITDGETVGVTMSEDGSPTPFSLTLNATDPDGNTLTWSISTPASHGTATASGTGFSKSIGYVPDLNYSGLDSFVVQVSDGLLTDTITVNVTINAVNTAPTALGLSNNEIDENQPSGTLIGTFTTTDSDIGDSFTYSFCGGTDDASFQISSDQLLSAASFNFEAKSSYSICVRSTDSGALNIDETITINVNDLVDTATFLDVPVNHWAWRYVESLATAGITSGCGAGNYCPDNQVTRAQMAIFLLRGIHGSSYTPPAATGTVFNDVGAGDFAAAWIEQMVSEGITSGCGGGNYCPNATVTRAQMAIFLLRAKYGSGYTPPAATGTVFPDVPLGSFGAAWIEQLVSEGVTSGCGGGNYCPNAPVTRAQMAVFLARIFTLPLP